MVEPRGGNGVICLGFDERAVLRTTLGSKRWRRKKTPLVTQTTLTAQATLPQSELQADSCHVLLL